MKQNNLRGIFVNNQKEKQPMKIHVHFSNPNTEEDTVRMTADLILKAAMRLLSGQREKQPNPLSF